MATRQRQETFSSNDRVSPTSLESAPRTWLMLGHKAGDNGQIRALAQALGWPFETKHLRYRKTELVTNLLAGPTLLGLIKDQSSPLEPPWPDLIISAGRRNEPLVRWIQREAGGPHKVRIVHVGRPWALHECFDLIVTTPQYRLPTKPNILHNEAPLHLVNQQRLDKARAQWGPRLAHLAGPRIAVMLGGNAGPYNFDRENGALLGYHANRLAREAGGSLMVTSSARTPKKALEALEAQIDVPAVIYRWRPDADDNPYFGFLALADQLIVTCDSMSMLAEACTTRKPVHIFDLRRGPGSNRPPDPPEGAFARRSWLEKLVDFRPGAIIYRISMVTGPKRLTRDVGIIHERQVEAGRAVWLGQPWPQDRPPAPPMDDLARAASLTRSLFDPTSPLARAMDGRKVSYGPTIFVELWRRIAQG